MFYTLWHTYLPSIFDWVIETSILASVLVVFYSMHQILIKKLANPSMEVRIMANSCGATCAPLVSRKLI